MPIKEFPPDAQSYRNEWIALSRDEKIVGHGKKPEDAISSAEAAGYKDVTLFFIPDEWPKVLIV